MIALGTTGDHEVHFISPHAFLQYRRLKTARRQKKFNGLPPQPTLPAVRQAMLELIARRPKQRCRIAENGFATSSGVSKSAIVLGVVAELKAAYEALGAVLDAPAVDQESIEWQQREEETNDKLNRAIDALCKTPVRTMRGLIAKLRIGEIDRDVAWATTSLYRSSTTCSHWRPSTRSSCALRSARWRGAFGRPFFGTNCPGFTAGVFSY
jgi:hypothetical protein